MCRIDDYDEGPEFFQETEPRARKEHRCGDCGRTIKSGEKYLRSVGKWGYEINSHVTCAHCKAASRWLQTACGGYLFGGIGEELREHWHEEPGLRSVMLARLVIGHRDHWHDGRDRVPDPDQVSASVPIAARS